MAEELGFDAYADRGAPRRAVSVCRGPACCSATISATTTRIRLQTGVAVLSVLDPVRVAEDYATIDQPSHGRLELVIGKSNEVRHFPMFGLYLEDQWDLLAENTNFSTGFGRPKRTSPGRASSGPRSRG